MRRSSPFLSALLPFVAMAPLTAQQTDLPIFRPMGFGDVSYVVGEQRTEGFFVGQLVGHLTAVLSDRLNGFVEVSATARPSEYGFEVERLFLRYDVADWLKLSAGRFHTPVGYWNTAFHHGLWLQTSVARPEMIRFGSRLIPVHFVGLQVEGTLAPATAALTYALGVGNGRGAVISRGGDAGDVNDDRAFTVNISARPPGAVGLQFGGGLYIDRIARGLGEPEIRERIASAHVAWTRTGPELIAEYARSWHAPDGAGEEFAASDAWYIQAAYRLPGRERALKPYARYEKTAVSADDGFLKPLDLDYEAFIAGIRYDFTPLAALKLEYRNEDFTGERVNSLFVQLSFALSGITATAM